jgi:hypothetical protein
MLERVTLNRDELSDAIAEYLRSRHGLDPSYMLIDRLPTTAIAPDPWAFNVVATGNRIPQPKADR